MLGRDHITFGFISAAAVSVTAYNPQSPIFAYPVIITGFAVIGSMLPEVDQPQAAIGKYVLPLANAISRHVEHRTITHDISIMVPLFLLSILTKNPIFFGIMFGVMSHLFLDALTQQGLCKSYFAAKYIWKKDPLHKKCRFHLLPVRLRVESGGFAARLITYALCAGVVFLLNAGCEYFRGVGLMPIIGRIVEGFH